MDQSTGLKVTIVKDPNERVREADRYTAVKNLILSRGLANCSETTFRERVELAREAAAQNRLQTYGNGVYIVLELDGAVEHFEPDQKRDCVDFAVCVDAFRREKLDLITREQVICTLAALGASFDDLFSTRKVYDTIICFEETSERPIYSYSFSMSAEGYASRVMRTEVLDSIQETYLALRSEPGLERVVRLLVASLETDSDYLRAFLASWNSLEVLIKKSFPYYEKLAFSDVSASGNASIHKAYWARIQDVMKDKYNITDQFVLVASWLAPQDADADLIQFKSLKKIRDKLSHGEAIQDETLPVRKTQEFVRKYLLLHTQKIQERSGAGAA